MIIIWGMAYMVYLFILGAAIRLLFWRHHDPRQTALTFTAHAFMTGVAIHILLFNALQWLLNSPQYLVLTVSLLLVVALFWVVIAWRRYQPVIISKPRPTNLILGLVLLLFSVMMWQLGHWLPNLAWDSWTVWEGKANQWLHHGWSLDFATLNSWLVNEDTLFNPSPAYPEGLPLLYYWPKLLTPHSLGAVHSVYLMAFAMTTWLLIQRLSQSHAPGYLLGLVVLVMYTTPLMSNHLIMQGYADIWVGMFLLLAILSLANYHQHPTTLNALSTLLYLLATTWFKLEGWAWVLTWSAAWVLVMIYRHRLRWVWLAMLLMLPLTVMLIGGFEWHTPLGDLVITAERLTLFNLIDTPLQFTNVSSAVMASLLWQNNWLLLWLALPWVVILGPWQLQTSHDRFAALFMLLAVSSILLLFYFTKASQWAVDFTAINRLWLQLTPVLIYLVFALLNGLPGVQKNPHQTQQHS